MSKVILTLNAGSSSLKFAVFAAAEGGEPELMASGQIEGIGAIAKGEVKTPAGKTAELAFNPAAGAVDHRAAMAAILGWLRSAGEDHSVAAVGHRVVHGGPDLVEPTLVDADVVQKLKRLIPLAPLHEPHNIAGIEAAMQAFPSAPQVACFDTAFHRTHPLVSDTFALPPSYYEEGVRRYGFHGLSYEYITRRMKTFAPEIARDRFIVAHLGNGASMCAIRDGRSVASSMGFTALDGLPMGTRCGQIDPGVLLYLMSFRKMSYEAISDLLYKHSGLKGMSGISQDVRELEAADTPAARNALAYFVARVKREIGALAASLGGARAIVFTAGIGEHAWRVREAALTDMEWMGVRLDPEANRASAQVISTKYSPVTVFVIPTDEERMIAEHTANVAGLGGATSESARA